MGKIKVRARKYSLSPTGVLVVGFLTVSVTIFLISSVAEALNNHTYYNCSELERAGYSHIKRGDKYYSPALDRDHDGVACES